MNDGLETREDIEDCTVRAMYAVMEGQGNAAATDLELSGESYPISDLICNLLHLGDKHGFDPDDLINSARLHFDAGRIDWTED